MNHREKLNELTLDVLSKNLDLPEIVIAALTTDISNWTDTLAYELSLYMKRNEYDCRSNLYRYLVNKSDDNYSKLDKSNIIINGINFYNDNIMGRYFDPVGNNDNDPKINDVYVKENSIVVAMEAGIGLDFLTEVYLDYDVDYYLNCDYGLYNEGRSYKILEMFTFTESDKKELKQFLINKVLGEM